LFVLDHTSVVYYSFLSAAELLEIARLSPSLYSNTLKRKIGNIEAKRRLKTLKMTNNV